LASDVREERAPQLDRACLYLYTGNSTVIHFFDAMNFSYGPAAIRWAALF